MSLPTTSPWPDKVCEIAGDEGVDVMPGLCEWVVARSDATVVENEKLRFLLTASSSCLEGKRRDGPDLECIS